MKNFRSLSSFSSAKVRPTEQIARYGWFALQHTLFILPAFPSNFRVACLKLFGARIGRNVLFRRGVKVQFPWNLEIGDDCWIGEETWFINHAKITVGSNVCISQRSIICSGGHDYRTKSLTHQHNPIQIKDGAWICLDSKVLPGVTIGECSVISAGEIVRKSVPDFSMLIEGQIRAIEAPK